MVSAIDLLSHLMFKASAQYFFIRAANGVLSLLTIYILTRLLSAEQYGIYALCMATIGFCGSILFQWISVSLSRYYCKYLDDHDVLLSEAYRLFIYVVCVGILSLFLLFFLLPSKLLPLVASISVVVGAIAIGMHSISINVANASTNPIQYGLLTVTRSGLALLFAAVFATTELSGAGAALGVGIAGLFSVGAFGPQRKMKNWHNNKNIRREIFRYGFPLSLSFVATAVIDLSDRVMLGWWQGAEVVGGYAASYDLSQQTVGAILNIFFLASYPKIVESWERQRKEIALQKMKSLFLALKIALPFLIGVFFSFSPEISNIFFGGDVSIAAMNVMPWVSLAIAIGCLKTFYLDIPLQLLKNTKVQFTTVLMMACINVVANALLIPYFGGQGAAASTVISFLVGALISYSYGKAAGMFSISIREIGKSVILFLVFVGTSKIDFFLDRHMLFSLSIRFIMGMIAFILFAIIINLKEIKEYKLNSKIELSN